MLSKQLRRLSHLKKCLHRDPHLFEEYNETIDGHVSRGYVRLVPHEELQLNEDTPVWCQPIIQFFIHKSQERLELLTAQYKGSSPNNELLQGPHMTNKRVGVLTSFRQEQVAVVADKEGMFRQV